ncbi:hypothetical protein BTM495_04620 [Helicobacter pylori]
MRSQQKIRKKSAKRKRSIPPHKKEFKKKEGSKKRGFKKKRVQKKEGSKKRGFKKKRVQKRKALKKSLKKGVSQKLSKRTHNSNTRYRVCGI